jgi:uncharacterized BrkB/YihY/UPF0761 family membrane protein
MNRNLIFAIAFLLVFGAITAILLVLMPGPHRPTDYLVIGAIATLLCLLLAFFVMIKTLQSPDEVKRRKPD